MLNCCRRRHQRVGHYSWQGSCDAISCGAPPPLPHATPRMSDAWPLTPWAFIMAMRVSILGGWLPQNEKSKTGKRLESFEHQTILTLESTRGSCLWFTLNVGAEDIKRQNWTYGVTIHYDCVPWQRGEGEKPATIGLLVMV